LEEDLKVRGITLKTRLGKWDPVWKRSSRASRSGKIIWLGQFSWQETALKKMNFCSTYMWPPLWSSGQRTWPQIQRSGFDSWHYQIFWEVVGLEQGPLSLVSTIEELLGRKE
jgi:hypothetical protein